MRGGGRKYGGSLERLEMTTSREEAIPKADIIPIDVRRDGNDVGMRNCCCCPTLPISRTFGRADSTMLASRDATGLFIHNTKMMFRAGK
jgi:hypothetical protein